MKKTISKVPQTPVKAKPTPASAKAPVSSKPAAPAPKVKKSAKAAAATPAPKPIIPAVKNPVVEVVAPTVIVAQVDIGFGNQLFIRGEGAGLSWNQGVALENLAADRWQVVLEGVTAPVTFKFLINDQTWSEGEDYVVSAGSSLILVPSF